MSIVKVIEVIAESDTGWEDAAQNAVSVASETIKNVRHIYVKEMTAVVENGEIVKYRLNANLSFVVDQSAD